jgi:hypothetical protein
VSSKSSDPNSINNELYLGNEHFQKWPVPGSPVHGVTTGIFRAVPDCYFERDRAIGLDCQIWIRLGGAYQANICAILDGFGTDRDVSATESWAKKFKVQPGGRSSSHLDQPVLVSVAEIPEDGEQGGNTGCLLLNGWHERIASIISVLNFPSLLRLFPSSNDCGLSTMMKLSFSISQDESIGGLCFATA